MFQTQFVFYSGLSALFRPYLSIEAIRSRQRASQAAAIKQALSAPTNISITQPTQNNFRYYLASNTIEIS